MALRKREKIRGKNKRMERISELAETLFQEHYNEDSAPADVGDVIELVCLIADQLKELHGSDK
jgi:hypothetical protein